MEQSLPIPSLHHKHPQCQGTVLSNHHRNHLSYSLTNLALYSPCFTLPISAKDHPLHSSPSYHATISVMSLPAPNSTEVIQVADNSIYPIHKAPSVVSEKPGGPSDVEQGLKINAGDFNLTRRNNSALPGMLCHLVWHNIALVLI